MTQAATIAADTLRPARSRRSGSGSSAKGAAPVEISPIRKANPTLADLAGAIDRLHECVHTASEKSDAGFTKLHERVDDVVTDIGEVAKKVAYIEGAQSVQAKALGVPTPPPVGQDGPVEKGFRTLATTKPWVAVWGGVGALSATVIGYRILAEIGPIGWAFLKSLHHTLMTVPTS